jgi:hypothetical protein
MADSSNSIFEGYYSPPSRHSCTDVLQDFVTRERRGEVTLTYANQDVVKSLLETPIHRIDIPVDTPTSTIPKPLTTAPPTSPPKTTTPLEVRLKSTPRELTATIRNRFERGLRQDYLAQVRVNARLLDGFEGFHGELAELWTRKREAKDRQLARAKIRDERKNAAIKKDALDDEKTKEDAGKVMQRLGHTVIRGSDSEQNLLRTWAKTEERQEGSGNSDSVGIVEERVVEDENAPPSEEEASHVGLGGVETVETSTEQK